MLIRDERTADIDAIRRVVTAAFANVSLSQQTEPAIVDRLRSSGAMSLSLVALEGDEIVGHIAFSPVTIAGRNHGWHGLGPVAVRPDQQGRGIGQALVRGGLERLQTLDARGCVLVGEPKYYERFGFRVYPQLTLAGLPPQYFLALPFAVDVPEGPVQYHGAFA